MKIINTLYLIDDDSVFQFLASEVIQATQLVEKIQVFSNGYEAIKFLESIRDDHENLPDVIFLDLFMPIMDGWGFLKEFGQLKPRLPKKIAIYILSSSIDPADIERSKTISEVTDFIIKPITQQKFINTLKAIG